MCNPQHVKMLSVDIRTPIPARVQAASAVIPRDSAQAKSFYLLEWRLIYEQAQKNDILAGNYGVHADCHGICYAGVRFFSS